MSEDKKQLIDLIKSELDKLSQQENICIEHLNSKKWIAAMYHLEMSRIARRKDDLINRLERVVTIE